MRELIIPPHLGYGRDGAGKIPPHATLYFRMELVAVPDSLFKGFLDFIIGRKG